MVWHGGADTPRHSHCSPLALPHRTPAPRGLRGWGPARCSRTQAFACPPLLQRPHRHTQRLALGAGQEAGAANGCPTVTGAPPRTQQVAPPVPIGILEVGTRHGAQCPASSGLSLHLGLSGAPPHHCPHQGHTSNASLAWQLTNQSNHPLTGLWGNSNPIEVVMVSVPVTCGHISTHPRLRQGGFCILTGAAPQPCRQPLPSRSSPAPPMSALPEAQAPPLRSFRHRGLTGLCAEATAL